MGEEERKSKEKNIATYQKIDEPFEEGSDVVAKPVLITAEDCLKRESPIHKEASFGRLVRVPSFENENDGSGVSRKKEKSESMNMKAEISEDLSISKLASTSKHAENADTSSKDDGKGGSSLEPTSAFQKRRKDVRRKTKKYKPMDEAAFRASARKGNSEFSGEMIRNCRNKRSLTPPPSKRISAKERGEHDSKAFAVQPPSERGISTPRKKGRKSRNSSIGNGAGIINRTKSDFSDEMNSKRHLDPLKPDTFTKEGEEYDPKELALALLFDQEFSTPTKRGAQVVKSCNVDAIPICQESEFSGERSADERTKKRLQPTKSCASTTKGRNDDDIGTTVLLTNRQETTGSLELVQAEQNFPLVEPPLTLTNLENPVGFSNEEMKKEVQPGAFKCRGMDWNGQDSLDWDLSSLEFACFRSDVESSKATGRLESYAENGESSEPIVATLVHSERADEYEAERIMHLEEELDRMRESQRNASPVVAVRADEYEAERIKHLEKELERIRRRQLCLSSTKAWLKTLFCCLR